MHKNTNHLYITSQINKTCEIMLIHVVLLRCLESMQYQLNLHNIASEERVRRNVGEPATDSQDP